MKRRPGRMAVSAMIGFASLLPAESLVIGICRSNHELLRARVENGLLRVVRAARQASHLHLQRHCIFRFSHVRVDA
jgi:hypothetical protein